MALTHALATNNYGPAHLIVATSAANGTHTTLTTAMADAVSGDTIFLRDSVTENVTITPGVNIACWSGDSLNVPSITGTLTMTAAGTSTISGLRLVTNSAALMAVTGSAASILNVNNCYLNCSNNTGITYSSSNAASMIYVFNCKADLGTTGIGLFAHSSTGLLEFNNMVLTNTGGSSTASTISAGNLRILFGRFFAPITSSGTGSVGINNSNFDTSAQNVTCLTIGGSGNGSTVNCNYSSGSASTISISAAYSVFNTAVSCSNTNAITGVGAILYSAVTFGTSTTINVTTQSVAGTLQGSKNTAPTAGFLGERITSAVTAVATTSSTPKSITSISLTAGIWDVSAIATSQPTGGTAIMQAQVMGISATNNTLEGNVGDQQAQINQATLPLYTGVVPSFRVTLSATTTYYVVVNNVYTSTTCPTNARISATRVG